MNCEEENYYTPLTYFSRFGPLVAVMDIIEANTSELNLPDKDGWTPLICGIVGGNEAIVNYLILKGADVKYIDRDGMTPLDHAEYRNLHKIARLIKMFGGKNMIDLV